MHSLAPFLAPSRHRRPPGRAAPGAPPAELDEDGAKKDEPWFPSKLSACQLYPAIFACMPKDGFAEEKTTLLENFAALADDEMPMVRPKMMINKPRAATEGGGVRD